MFEAFYGLSGKPFQLNPDPSFFYGSKGHTSAFSYLQFGVYQSEGFIVITGEIGAGKTTLVRALLQQLDSNEVVAVQLVSTLIDADDLLRAVATAFGLPSRDVDKAHLLATLEAYLISLLAQGKRALLVVDEAQNLTPRAIEELRMLSNFQFGDRALLQSFLVGQPELRAVLRSPSMEQLRQRVIASYHLGPMKRDETAAYIRHRLQHVGWQNDPAFTDDAFAAIYDATRGVPRKINTLCNRLLLAVFLEEKHEVDRPDVDKVMQEFTREFGGHAVPHAATGAAAEPPKPRQSSSAVALAGIATRLDRIEKNVALLLEALRPEEATSAEDPDDDDDLADDDQAGAAANDAGPAPAAAAALEAAPAPESAATVAPAPSKVTPLNVGAKP